VNNHIGKLAIELYIIMCHVYTR